MFTQSREVLDREANRRDQLRRVDAETDVRACITRPSIQQRGEGHASGGGS